MVAIQVRMEHMCMENAGAVSENIGKMFCDATQTQVDWSIKSMFAKAYVEITDVCNRQCAFCPGTRRAPGFMSADAFREIAVQLQGLTRYLYFHLMGEPLLHEALPELLDIAGQMGFRVILTTNGTLLPDRSEALLQAPALHKVNISLHSFEANSEQVFFDAYLEGCTAFANAASAQGILCNFRLWNLDGEETTGKHDRNDEILEHLRRAFSGQWVQNTRGTRLQDRVFLEWGERFAWPDLTARDRGEKGFCYGLRDQIGILCDGTVVPCCLDHEGDLALGNIFHMPLGEILMGQRASAIRAGFDCRKAVEPLCRRCGYAGRFLKEK